MRDGKPVGTIDGDNYKKSDGQESKLTLEDAPETIDVPLDGGEPRRTPKKEVKEKEESDEVVEEITEDEESQSADTERLASIENTLRILMDRLNPPKDNRPNDTLDIDAIPDDLPADKDPFGIAKTLKNVAKSLKSVNERVSRLDQHTGFTEAMKQLEVEKGRFDIYKDKTLGTMASKLLEAELATNRVDPMTKIVAKVAKDVGKLAVASTVKRADKKREEAEKVPSALRTKDGTTPAITVKKPQNISEASAAYKAFREARGKLQKG